MVSLLQEPKKRKGCNKLEHALPNLIYMEHDKDNSK